MTTTITQQLSRTAALGARGLFLTLVLIAGAGIASAQTAPKAPEKPAAAKPAADQTAAPASTTTGAIEVGVGDVTDASFKASEFNGLQKKGAFMPTRFDLRGGGTYESDNALRWRLIGSELALDTRGVTAEVGVQGKYRLTAGFSQLRRNRSDSYQTPYNGAGTNALRLPSSWLVPVIASSSAANNHATTNSARGLIPAIGGAAYLDTKTGSPTLGTAIAADGTQLGLMNAAAAADLPLFHNVDLFMKRNFYDAGISADLSGSWAFAASMRAEHKDGMKPLSTVSRSAGGDIATIIPDLIDTNTNQINSSLTYTGDKAYAQAAYYGSFFTNHVSSMSWQNWASGPGTTATVNTMSSTPSNTFNQFSVTGRYNFSKMTRLVANGSYGRNTQNDTFLTLPSTLVVPVSSLNGLVISTSFDARLTSRIGKKTNLSAFYKFNNRDNQTAVRIYQFADAEESISPNTNFAGNPLGALLANNANANRPYSRKVNLFAAEADYALAQGQVLKAGYSFERNNRACPGSWIDCADAGVTNEHTMRGEWRADLGTAVHMRTSYAYAQRRTPSYNENAFLAIVPYANVAPSAATGGVSALTFMLANGWNGYGPVAGYTATTGNMNLFFPSNNALANAMYANANRISELVGMRRYYVSDRNRKRSRTAVNWQANDALSFQAAVDYTGDDYTDATYGVQSGRTWGTTVDATYEIVDGLSATAFYTLSQQKGVATGNSYTANSNALNVSGFTGVSGNGCDGYTSIQQRNNNNKVAPCLNWTSNTVDKVHTLGFNLLKKADKADVSADLIYSNAQSDNNVIGGSWANNPLALTGAAAGTTAAFFIQAAPLPAVTTKMVEARLNSRITITGRQSVRLFYTYMHMKNVDWQYDAMQIGAATMSGVLPTNETAFNYNVHVLGAFYVFRF